MRCAASGRVLIVGAGCGAGLITVRGLAAVRRAEVLVYDELLDAALLSEASEGCERIYAGKRAGVAGTTQEEIIALLIKKAREGKLVVRLKGGDPFVFGRGGEECLALAEAGIPYEVIPGVSSAIAVPGAAGIPVTHRALARSVTVVTGRTADGEAGEDYEVLAALHGTLVFLMGAGKLRQITDGLLRAGKPEDTPAAVIANGCSEDEERIDGTLKTIAELAQDVPRPAVLVVGETAGFSFAKRREEKRTVLLTGTEGFVRRMEEALAFSGRSVRAVPTLILTMTEDPLPKDLLRYDWLVLTSPNGADFFFRALREERVDLRALAGKRFACLGSGTAERLASYGLYADLVPGTYTARALGEALAERMDDTEAALLLRAENGSKELSEELAKKGKRFVDYALYRTEILHREELRESAEGADLVVFGSGSGVRAFFENGAKIPAQAKALCIGPVAAHTLRRYYDGPTLLPEHATTEELVGCVFRE